MEIGISDKIFMTIADGALGGIYLVLFLLVLFASNKSEEGNSVFMIIYLAFLITAFAFVLNAIYFFLL